MLVAFFLLNCCLAINCLVPLIITTNQFTKHIPSYDHPEQPARITSIQDSIIDLKDKQKIEIRLPTAELDSKSLELAESIIRIVHSRDYCDEVKEYCKRGYKKLSPWDSDTYISKQSYDVAILAQSAWIDAVNEVVNNKNMAFAISRPPGHHALKSQSMGFCIFNFAIGAAHYAMSHHNIERIGILDFDVHYGNGVADLMKSNSAIRYVSLHQADIFPYGEGKSTEKGLHNNILNIPVPSGTTWSGHYRDMFNKVAIPFIKEFDPQLLIVSAGYDGLARDSTAELQFRPEDYAEISKDLIKNFGTSILFGLEGGYDLVDLPKAVRCTIEPFID